MPADHLGEHRELAARDLDPGELGAGSKPARDLLEHGGIRALDRDVVEQRDRLGADAHDVVDVHRDAVDPDRVEASQLLGEDQLGADAVGRHRDTQSRRDLEDAGVVAAAQARARRPADVDRAEHIDDGPYAAPGLVRVDAGACVGVAHQRAASARRRRYRRAVRYPIPPTISTSATMST